MTIDIKELINKNKKEELEHTRELLSLFVSDLDFSIREALKNNDYSYSFTNRLRATINDKHLIQKYKALVERLHLFNKSDISTIMSINIDGATFEIEDFFLNYDNDIADAFYLFFKVKHHEYNIEHISLSFLEYRNKLSEPKIGMYLS